MAPDRPVIDLPRVQWKGRVAWYVHSGKPRRWERLGRTEREIRDAHARITSRPKPTPGTVDAMLADAISAMQGKVAPGTLCNYRSYRKHLSAVFGYCDPADAEELNQAAVLRYLETCPRMTFRNEIGLLSLAYIHWMRQGRLTFNPCFGVRTDRKGSKRTRLLEPHEIDGIIGASEEREAVAWELQYALGVRIGDLCRLRWTDFVTSLETQKTRARQAWIVTPDLRALLDRAKALQARVASPYVLCDRGGQAWTPDRLRDRFHAAADRAGVRDAVPHDLRAAAGTEVDRQGGDAQKFLGHRQRSTTETYLRDRRANVVLPLSRKRGTG